MRARFPFHPIGVSHWSTPFDTQRHADSCRTRYVSRRAWAPWSRGWTLRHTRVRLPVLHCTLDSPSLYRGGGKGHTNAPFRSYGSGTLLRVLNPCVGPASSTALMTVTRTVLTIPGPYTHRRWSEVSFTRSQGPYRPGECHGTLLVGRRHRRR